MQSGLGRALAYLVTQTRPQRVEEQPVDLRAITAVLNLHSEGVEDAVRGAGESGCADLISTTAPMPASISVPVIRASTKRQLTSTCKTAIGPDSRTSVATTVNVNSTPAVAYSASLS